MVFGSRILVQRDEDYFEMQQLRVPVMEDAAQRRIERIHDPMFRGSLFLQRYARQRRGR